jgi:hypothetical protein
MNIFINTDELKSDVINTILLLTAEIEKQSNIIYQKIADIANKINKEHLESSFLHRLFDYFICLNENAFKKYDYVEIDPKNLKNLDFSCDNIGYENLICAPYKYRSYYYYLDFKHLPRRLNKLEILLKMCERADKEYIELNEQDFETIYGEFK